MPCRKTNNKKYRHEQNSLTLFGMGFTFISFMIIERFTGSIGMAHSWWCHAYVLLDPKSWVFGLSYEVVFLYKDIKIKDKDSFTNYDDKILNFFDHLKVRQSPNYFFNSTFPPKKGTNEFYFTTMKPQVNFFSFVFWRKLKTLKRHFEINWPLPPPLTFYMVWRLTKSGHFWTKYLPRLTNV